MTELVLHQPTGVALYRQSTEAADICKSMVVATAKTIGDRRYVCVEGWMSIAVAHGCAASACDVERVEGGVRAKGIIRRMSDGAIIAEAEGFVGEDEPTWFGGLSRSWKWGDKRGEKVWYDKELPKRPDYAIRAMAQTRAISRACRSAFAHVVVMMDAGLSTTPAEEVPADCYQDAHFEDKSTPQAAPAARADPPKAEQPKTPPTLVDRVARFQASLERATSTDKLRTAWELGSGLCATLSEDDSKTLTKLETLYAERFGQLADAETQGASA